MIKSDVWGGIVKLHRDTGQPLHHSLSKYGIAEYPYTISFALRKRLEIITWYENLPRDKVPPEDIWFDGVELEMWFDNVFGGKEPQAIFDINPNEIEG